MLTHEEAAGIIHTLDLVQADAEADVKALDGQPFVGLTVGTQFGHHAASIDCLAKIVVTLVKEVAELSAAARRRDGEVR